MNKVASSSTLVYRRVAVMTALLVLILLSLPGDWIKSMKSLVGQWWLWGSPSNGSSDFPLDKLVHGVLFSVCGALFALGWCDLRQRSYLFFALLLSYALLTEVIQIFVPGRSASLGDLAADVIGITLGIGLASLNLKKLDA